MNRSITTIHIIFITKKYIKIIFDSKLVKIDTLKIIIRFPLVSANHLLDFFVDYKADLETENEQDFDTEFTKIYNN